MTINLSPSRLINVGVIFTPSGVQAASLNTGLVLGTSTVIDTVTRMRNYNSLAAIATDFGTSAEEYLAAVPWFGQSPQPTSMLVGRWCKTAAKGALICAPLITANRVLGPWNAVVAGSFKVAVDGGVATNVPAMNFAGAVTFAGIAAIMQVALQGLGGAFAAATVLWNSVYSRFEISSGTTGASSAVSFLTAGTTGVDISGMMNGLAAGGGYVAPGVAAQTALETVVLFDNQFGGQWYNLFMPSTVDADQISIVPYIDGDATPHFYWVNTQDSSVLVAGSTTNIAYLLKALAGQHVAWQYSSTSLYAVWSMAARIATVNWAGSNTAISLMYKTEPGIVAEALTATQASALDGYNGNVYVNYAFGTGTPIIEQGICPSGQFIDTIIGVDGLRQQIQVNMFNLQLTTATKIPQTDEGVGTLENGAAQACSQYIVNGLGAPGVWNGDQFGQLQTGQWLDKGYYIYSQPIALQSQAQRSARICPPIQVAFKLAGAIDTVNATIYVNS